MSRVVLDILGFSEVESSISIIDIPVLSSRPMNILNAAPKQLFVYSDICKPCVIGDVQSSLLRIIPVKYKDYTFVSTQYQTFTPIHYLPVSRNSFCTIIIDIRDDLARKILFQCGSSTVIVKLLKFNTEK